jgi:uridine kinase
MKKKEIQSFIKQNHELDISGLLTHFMQSSFGDSYVHLNPSHSKDQLYLGPIRWIENGYACIDLIEKGDYWIQFDTVSKLAKQSVQIDSQSKMDFDHRIQILKSWLLSKKYTDELSALNESLHQIQTFPNQFLNHQIEEGSGINSYFIVKKNYLTQLTVFSAIDQILLDHGTALISIDGNSSSGKTTFSAFLKEIYQCNLFHMDDYFMKPVIKSGDPFSIYGSNIDFMRLSEEVFEPIIKKKDSIHRLLDTSVHQLSEPVVTKHHLINIIEGAYSMHPYLDKKYDLKIFMKTTYLKQLKRIYQRNGFSRWIDYINRWIPNENRYFRDLDIARHADIILKS